MKKLLFFFTFLCCSLLCTAQNKLSYSVPGLQFGYATVGINKFDAGLNYHMATCIYPPDGQEGYDHYRIKGIFASATGIKLNDAFYVGGQAGAYFHYLHTFITYRMAVVYEYNLKADTRIGGEMGLGFLCFFLYYGYYHPVGAQEQYEISRNRFGIRLIINTAAVEATPNLWE